VAELTLDNRAPKDGAVKKTGDACEPKGGGELCGPAARDERTPSLQAGWRGALDEVVSKARQERETGVATANARFGSGKTDFGVVGAGRMEDAASLTLKPAQFASQLRHVPFDLAEASSKRKLPDVPARPQECANHLPSGLGDCTNLHFLAGFQKYLVIRVRKAEADKATQRFLRF
jgi:hypothetical protein